MFVQISFQFQNIKVGNKMAYICLKLIYATSNVLELCKTFQVHRITQKLFHQSFGWNQRSSLHHLQNHNNFSELLCLDDSVRKKVCAQTYLSEDDLIMIWCFNPQLPHTLLCVGGKWTCDSLWTFTYGCRHRILFLQTECTRRNTSRASGPGQVCWETLLDRPTIGTKPFLKQLTRRPMIHLQNTFPSPALGSVVGVEGRSGAIEGVSWADHFVAKTSASFLPEVSSPP